MRTEFGAKNQIINEPHIKNIFADNLYLELGIIDVSVIRRILEHQIINIKDVTYFPIQNNGLGHSDNLNENLKSNLPFFFFRNLFEDNSDIQLVITYGLCYYRDYEKKDKFAPIIFIPITMFYEKNETFIRMIGKPFENPAIYTIYKSKLSFLINESLEDVYSLDRVIQGLLKLNPNSVRIDNFLTYVHRKHQEIIIDDKEIFNKDYSLPLANDMYYSLKVLNEVSENIIRRAYYGNNVAFTGISGTGKTSIIESTLINALYKKKKVLYFSNSVESIEEVNKFLYEKGLGKIVLNLCKIHEDKEPQTISYKNISFEKLSEKKEQIKNHSEYVRKYEKCINETVSDFKFIDCLNKFCLIEGFNEVKDFYFPEEDFDYLYKNEYYTIHDSLLIIEENSKKIESFKNSVWNQIPYINNIKYANQIINIIFKLDQGFKALRKNEISLESYGVNTITSFSGMKRCIEPIKRIDMNKVPKKWRENIIVFKEALESFQQLKEEIKEYEECDYRLNTEYVNLNSINIDEELGLLNFKNYKMPKECINNIIKDIDNASTIAKNTEKYLKQYNMYIKQIERGLGWNFTTLDSSIADVQKLMRIFINNSILEKTFTSVIMGKEASLIKELNNLNQIILIEKDDLSNFCNEHPKIYRLLKKSKDNNEILLEYNKRLGKIIQYENEYLNLTGKEYIEHNVVIQIINEIKRYYNEVKAQPYVKKIISFIQKFYNSKDTDKSFEIIFKSYLEISDLLNSSIEYLKDYGLKVDNLSISDAYILLGEFVNYIQQINGSLKRVKGVYASVKESIFVEDYEIIKEMQSRKEHLIKELKENGKFTYLFDYLYQAEATDYNNISNIIQDFSSYISNFTNEENAIKSIYKINEINKIVEDTSSLVDSIGESLREYNLIFKDGVSRYYFSNIEQNIEYLGCLLNAKEELKIYLNITLALKPLNDLNLYNLVSYIASSDKIENLSNTFDYVYFKRIIDNMMQKEPSLSCSSSLVEMLNTIITEEDEYCQMVNNNILDSINKSTISSKKVESYYEQDEYSSYITKAKVTLSNVQYMNEYLKSKQFDMIIIDDAHLIYSGIFSDILYKGNQIIICGNYQSNNVVNENLMALVHTPSTTILRNRVKQGPRKLTMNLVSSSSPFLKKLDDNIGVSVTKNVEECVYDLYCANNDVKINCFVKEYENQNLMYESIANFFTMKGVDENIITELINNKLHIVDLGKGIYTHSDYDILVFEDYYSVDSKIHAENFFEILMLSKKGIIIYDKNEYLKGDFDYYFFKKIKGLYNNNDVFVTQSFDPVTSLIGKMLSDRGYKVVYPGNGINLGVIDPLTNEIISIAILFSNGNVYNTISNYRLLVEDYIGKGHNVIIKTMMDLVSGSEEFVNSLCEEIDGKR